MVSAPGGGTASPLWRSRFPPHFLTFTHKFAEANAHTDTFRVDFGIAANPVPPFAPVVTAENNGTLTTITARWHTDSSDIDHYRYAIGTTPGAWNVVGWAYLTTNSMERRDLALSQGQPYYVSVQARNKFGLWSANGVSNRVVVGEVTSLPTPATPTSGGPTPTATSNRLVVGDVLSASVEFEVNPTSPLLQPAVVGGVISITKQLYLPLIHR